MSKEKKILFYLRKDKYGWLSNFERAQQKVGYIVYDSNEHYYQSEKAKYDDYKDWIINAPNPFLAMIGGRSLRKKEMIDNWKSIKVNIMLKGLRAKFSQNGELRRKLLATGKATLHEDSPTDMFWGIKGKDMLGKLLIKVRKELRNEVK